MLKAFSVYGWDEWMVDEPVPTPQSTGSEMCRGRRPVVLASQGVAHKNWRIGDTGTERWAQKSLEVSVYVWVSLHVHISQLSAEDLVAGTPEPRSGFLIPFSPKRDQSPWGKRMMPRQGNSTWAQSIYLVVPERKAVLINEGWGVSEGHKSPPARYPVAKAGTICATK